MSTFSSWNLSRYLCWRYKNRDLQWLTHFPCYCVVPCTFLLFLRTWNTKSLENSIYEFVDVLIFINTFDSFWYCRILTQNCAHYLADSGKFSLQIFSILVSFYLSLKLNDFLTCPTIGIANLRSGFLILTKSVGVVVR